MPVKSKASFLEAYNSLTDKHLVNYFSTSRMRRHLINNGLITENGEVIPESEYKETKIRENLKRAFLEVIAHAMVEKSLEVERLRQGKLQRDLEELCRLNRVKRLREERQQRSEEAILSKLVINSPRSIEKSEFLETHYPDNTTNQNNQQKINKKKSTKRKHSQKNKQFHYQIITSSLTPYSSEYYSYYRQPKSPFRRSSNSSNTKINNKQLRTFTKHSKHHNNNNHNKSKDRDIQGDQHTKTIDDFHHENNAHNASEQVDDYNICRNNNKEVREARKTLNQYRLPSQTEVKQTSCIVKFMYLGISSTEESKIQHIIDQQKNKKEEKNSMNNNNDTNQSLSRLITVIQQPNGGNTHTLFKGLLQPGDTFQIISKRVYGFPFSLTIYVDGTQDTRISACCEYRHRQGARIGGKHGHFIYLSVEGSFPCFRCRAFKKLKQRQQQEKMKRKEKFTTDENDNKIQQEEADEYDNSDDLKVYEDDFETEDKKINGDGDYNEVEEKLEVVQPSGINKVDIITLNHPLSSLSTISRHNCREDSHLSSIEPEKTDDSKDNKRNGYDEINFMEYFQAALHSLVLNENNINGCLRCIIWLSISPKKCTLMEYDNDDDDDDDDDDDPKELTKKNQFCEAIIRQQDEDLMRLVLPQPNTGDKLKLRWPLNDLKITDKIKYVDFCNLSNVLTVPLSDVEKLELSLEIPEEDIMYKFVEHSSLKDDRLITFRNPLKIILEDEENDEMNSYSLLRFLYELNNGCNDDVENENPAERFENIKDDYDSGKSSESSPPVSPSLAEKKIKSPVKKKENSKSSSFSSSSSSSSLSSSSSSLSSSSSSLNSPSSKLKSSKITSTNIFSNQSNSPLTSDTLTPTFEKESENQTDEILDLEWINPCENKTVECSIENTTTTVNYENMKRNNSTESLENNTKQDPTITSVIHNDNVYQNSEFQSSSSSVTSGRSMELNSSLYNKNQVVDVSSQHSLPTSSSVLPSSTISSSPSSSPIFTTTLIGLEKPQLSSNSSIDDDISSQLIYSKEKHIESNNCKVTTNNNDHEMLTEFV
ncbi:unnamed protein product [Schistosoma haematobium]|nr:unnamed protein product [Schistosoma haematobium]